jgi:hypothetical protein
MIKSSKRCQKQTKRDESVMKRAGLHILTARENCKKLKRKKLKCAQLFLITPN